MYIIDNYALLSTILKVFHRNLKKLVYLGASVSEIEKTTKTGLNI